MDTFADLAQYIKQFPDNWYLHDVDIDAPMNTIKVVFTEENERMSVENTRNAVLTFTGLVHFSYSPHPTEPPPTLIQNSECEELQSPGDIRADEGYMERTSAAYSRFFPLYRLRIVAWECELKILCRKIDFKEM